MTKIAVKLNLLIFIRSSELRFSRWTEINKEHRLWEIPANREELEKVRFSYRGSKMKMPHLIPLSNQALILVEDLEALSGDEVLMFPGDHYQHKPMSENTINKALRTMGFDTKPVLTQIGIQRPQTKYFSAKLASGGGRSMAFAAVKRKEEQLVATDK